MRAAERQRPPPGELYLDHVSHFVPDLDAAARLLERLGFVVTPRSEQQTPEGPVGAANRCVMLEDGYLEFLTPTLDTPAAQRMRASMARFTGVHLACFGTPDAEGEHRRLADHGFAPQPVVDLARALDGGSTVRFKVVRPALEHMPEGRIQYVEQLVPEAIWTERNLAHANGVTGLAALYVVADDAARVAARWAQFTALLPRSDGDLVVLECDRGRVLFSGTRALSARFGPVPAPPALACYALACRDRRAFLRRCANAGLAVRGTAVMLPPVLGGAWLVQEDETPH
jgi:hypothetical protein